MIGEDIYKRAKTLSNACTKIALLLPQSHALSGVARGELIKHATELGVKTRGLRHPQIPNQFVQSLYDARESVDGIGYWLEYILSEELMDENLVKPVLEESNGMIGIFSKGIQAIKDKLD
jgi:hypothetical protein